MTWVLRLLVVMILGISAVPAWAGDEGFERWAEQFKKKAIAQGIPHGVVEYALEGVEPDETVIALDRKQPENKITLEKYLRNTINSRRISTGRELMQEHEDLLEDISDTYHVQPQYVVALWGIESDFGTHQGGFSVVRSLATLAYEGRRRDFFSNELIAALKIIDKENMDPAALTGSWAGAMGNCQFMPSTYLKYAVDADNDGHRDIWNSTPDALASVANYLHSLGWKNDRGWGVEAQLPADFTDAENTLNHGRRADGWKRRGVTWNEETNQFGANVALYAIYTDKPNGIAHLVTDNYKVILQWNRSRYFATAVGTLAQTLENN